MLGTLRTALLALIAFAGVAHPALVSAQNPRRFVAMPPYASLALIGPDSLTFVAGPRTGVIVGAGTFDVGSPIALVRGGTLRVGFGRRFDVLAATAPMLRAASVDGSGDLDIGTINGPSFDGVVRGPGHLSVAALHVPRVRLINDGVGDLTVRALDADTVVIEMHGPGDVRVSGTARSVSINVYGTGDCDARGLTASDVSITLVGSGNVQARSSRAARISATGTGDVVVNGHPQCSVHATGAGEVVCG